MYAHKWEKGFKVMKTEKRATGGQDWILDSRWATFNEAWYRREVLKKQGVLALAERIF